MSAKPQLSIVVNPETGEVQESDERDLIIEGLKRENASLAGRLTKARNENAQLQGIEPGHKQVLEVLEFWRRTIMPTAKITVGSDRWKAVRTLLKVQDAETGEPAYTVLSLKAAAVGVKLSEWHVKNRQMDATTIYRDPKTADAHIARAVGFKRTYGVSALELVDELAGQALIWLAEPCSCGHLRVRHVVKGPTPDLRQPCADCGCEDFDWFTAQFEQHWLELRERAKTDPDAARELEHGEWLRAGQDEWRRQRDRKLAECEEAQQ